MDRVDWGTIVQDQDRHVSGVRRTQGQRSRFNLASNVLARLAVLALCAAAPIVSAAPAKPQIDLRSLLLKFAPTAPQATVSVAPRELRLTWTPASRALQYRIYEQRAPHKRLRQLGRALPRSATSATVALSAHLQSWNGTSYVIAACNIAGCTRSAPVSAADQAANAVEVVTSEYEGHEPSGGTANQTFGMQVALSGDGNTLAVSDNWYYGGSEWPWYGSGAVYVYGRVNNAWVRQAKLEPTNPRGYDDFGTDLALSADGNRLAVGSQYEGYDAPSQDAGPGTVFVFERVNDVWAQQAVLRATTPQDGASFGRTVELSGDGNVLAIGAPFETADVAGTAMAQAGAVYVFAYSNGLWETVSEVRAPNPQSYDRFGFGLRLSQQGATLAVLAAEQNEMTEDLAAGGWPNRNNTVYLFDGSSGAWELQGEIEGSPEEPMLGGYSYTTDGQVEGFALSADGRALAIASPFATAPDNGAGLVRMYERAGAYWAPAGSALTPSISERRAFGVQLAMSANGRTLAVTATREDGAYGEPYVVVFGKQNGTWAERAALQSPLYPDYSSFGNALSLSTSGDRLAVGSSSYNTAATSWGAVLVY